ncbi:MAG TPA: hypothetical protein VFZ32_21150 [Micromonosporaceae bacterium]
MNSATNSDSRWLFPGKRAGQPLHPRTLLPLIHQLGIPAQAIRVAALCQLVLQAPAPVIADALGYHDKHIAKVWIDPGGAWKTYALGHRSR